VLFAAQFARRILQLGRRLQRGGGVVTVKRRRYGATGHGYIVDGQKSPGVTRIIDETLPKQLTDWAARTGADEMVNHWEEFAELLPMERHRRVHHAYRNDRDAAAKRGTEIHRLAARLVAGEHVTPPEEIAGHVDAYVDFLNVIEPVPLLGGTELVLANRTHRYCGTADLVADLPALLVDDEPVPPCRWLLELKSTRSGIWPQSALQATAYTRAEVFTDPGDPDNERPVEWLQIKRTGVVWIRSDSWEFRPVDTSQETWDFFLHLRWLYDRREQMDAWIGPAIAPAAELEPA
jgi:hypothetical protein